MKITSQIFQAQLKCNTKCWLRSVGQTGKQNVYAEWDEIQNYSYRQRVSNVCLKGIPQAEYSLSPTSKDLSKPVGIWLRASLSNVV